MTPQGILAFFVLLAVLITVHELGHLIVAKLCGVKVLTFSIGMGPRLFGFQMGDTDYRVSAIPLGGYVKMHGDDITVDVPKEEERYSFLTQPFWKKSAIAVAGPLANLLLPVPLFFAFALGDTVVAEAVVGTLIPGEPAEKAGLLPGDRIVAIEGKPVRGFGDVVAAVNPRPGQPVRFTIVRGTAHQDLTVTPVASPAPELFAPDKRVGRIGFLAGVTSPVVTVLQGGVAVRAGVKAGDRIVSVNGAPVTSRTDVQRVLQDAAQPLVLGVKRGDATLTLTLDVPADATAVDVGDARFAVTRDEAMAAGSDALWAAHLTQPLTRAGLLWMEGRVRDVVAGTAAAELGIKVGDTVLAVDGTPLLLANQLETALRARPDDVHSVDVRSVDGAARHLSFRMAPAPERQMGGIKIFGLALESAVDPSPTTTVRVGAAEALQDAVKGTLDTLQQVVSGLWAFFTGKVGLASIGGPVSIYKVTNDVVAAGASTFVWWAAMLSVNLCVVNMLPVPVLDGGHLLLFTVEAIRRKRLTVAARVRATQVGLLFVGALMFIALTNDFLNLLI